MTNLKLYIIIISISCLLGNTALAQSNPVMNEIYSRGTTENPDWIEIYNPGSAAADISGYKIYDSGGQSGSKPKKVFPAGSVIPAYGFLVIVTEDSTESAFGLSSSGEWVWFENASGVVTDSVQFAAMSTTQSYGRVPNGGSWQLLNSITRGGSNILASAVVLPQYIQGMNGTNNNRLPFAYRLTVSQLLPLTTYRYINQLVIFSDGATAGGAGNIFFVNANGSLSRTTSTSFNTPGQYGEFTTDATGSYTGWFINEATSNARFTPGNYVRVRLRLNDGAGGTSGVHFITFSDSIQVINFGTAADPVQGSAIYGRSASPAKEFVFLYGNITGNGRPLSGTIVENDSVNLSTVTSFAQFYRDSVDNINGAWGTIIPNILPTGVRRIERRAFADGSVHSYSQDNDGIWNSGANTVNPITGASPLVITIGDAPVPVELISFTVTVTTQGVQLQWNTATETNNAGFAIERSEDGKSWNELAFVKGNGTTTNRVSYSFRDGQVKTGTYQYRLKQVDYSGTFAYSNIITAAVGVPDEFTLMQNYPNPFNPSTVIEFALPKDETVSLKVYNAIGEMVAELVNGKLTAGYHTAIWDASSVPSGIYYCRISAGAYSSVKKMMLVK